MTQKPRLSSYDKDFEYSPSNESPQKQQHRMSKFDHLPSYPKESSTVLVARIP